MYFLNLYKTTKDTKQQIKSVSIPCFNQMKGIGDALIFVGALQNTNFYSRHGQVIFFDGDEMQVIFEVSDNLMTNYMNYAEIAIPDLWRQNKGYRYEYWHIAKSRHSHIDKLQSCREAQDRADNNSRNVNVMQLLGFLVNRMSVQLSESHACSYYKEGYITDIKGKLEYTVTDRAIYIGSKINDNILIDFADFNFAPMTAKNRKQKQKRVFKAGQRLPKRNKEYSL